jgi:hypothetical protein
VVHKERASAVRDASARAIQWRTHAHGLRRQAWRFVPFFRIVAARRFRAMKEEATRISGFSDRTMHCSSKSIVAQGAEDALRLTRWHFRKRGGGTSRTICCADRSCVNVARAASSSRLFRAARICAKGESCARPPCATLWKMTRPVYTAGKILQLGW